MDNKFGEPGSSDSNTSPPVESPEGGSASPASDPLAPRPEFLNNIKDILDSEPDRSKDPKQLLSDLRGALTSLETLVGDLEKTSAGEHVNNQQYIQSAFQSTTASDLHNKASAVADNPDTLKDIQKLLGIQARLGDLVSGSQASKPDQNPNSWTHSGRTFNAIEEYSSEPGNVQVSSNDHEEYSSALGNVQPGSDKPEEHSSELEETQLGSSHHSDSDNDALHSALDTEAIDNEKQNQGFASSVRQLIQPADRPEDEINEAVLSTDSGTKNHEDNTLNTGVIKPPRFGLITGAALLAGRVALAVVTGGTIPLIDGGRDAFFGTRDGNIDKAALGAAKLAAGSAILIGIASANPALFAGGVIIYSSCLLYEYREDIKDIAKHGWNRLKT